MGKEVVASGNGWRRLNKDPKARTPVRYNFIQHGILFGNDSTSMASYMVDPGIYALEDLHWVNGNYSHTYTLYNLEARAALGYGAFKVEPGDVVYIGDFVVNASGEDVNIETVDNFAQAKTYIDGSYPAMSNKLQKRLVPMYNQNGRVKVDITDDFDPSQVHTNQGNPSETRKNLQRLSAQKPMIKSGAL